MTAGVVNSDTQVVFHHASTSALIRLHPHVLSRLRGYRQVHRSSKEAGGQLFGQVNDGHLEVTTCTGPYTHDKRSRYSYQSEPASAQKAIDRLSGKGLLYVGEWHTHPEPQPVASSMDVDAFERVTRLSDTRIATLILVIVGTHPDSSGISVYSHVDGLCSQWRVQDGAAN